MTRYQLRVGLGILWLVDGFLQLQPFMFTKGLALQIMAPTAVGQPAAVSGPIGLLVRLVSAHPAAFNTTLACAELAVGAGLIGLRDGRAARFISLQAIGLALGIWWLGEGLGGLASGHTGAAMGAPGAAALYAVVNLAAWPRSTQQAMSRAERRPRWLPGAWFVLWSATAVLTVLPAQCSPDGLAGQVLMGSLMSPGPLAHPELTLAHRLSEVSSGVAFTIAAVAALVQVGIAAGGLLSGRLRRASVIAGIAFAASCWVFCQGFGGISTGQATDVGTGPVLALLAVALLR